MALRVKTCFTALEDGLGNLTAKEQDVSGKTPHDIRKSVRTALADANLQKTQQPKIRCPQGHI